MSSQPIFGTNSSNLSIYKGNLHALDGSLSNPVSSPSQTLEFPYIISFLHSKQLQVDEIKLQALEIMTRVIKVCVEKDLEAITSKQTVSYGAGFRAKLGVIQSGLRLIGFSDRFGLSEIARLCPAEKNEKVDKLDRADVLWIRGLFTRLINYYEVLEGVKGVIAPAIDKVVSELVALRNEKQQSLEQLHSKQAEERPMVERLRKQIEEDRQQILAEGRTLHETEEVRRAVEQNLHKLKQEFSRVKGIESDLQERIALTTSRITKSPTKIQAERERIKALLIEAEEQFNTEMNLSKQTEEKAQLIASDKKEFTQRVADMGRLQAALLENHILEDKAADIGRTLVQLLQTEEHVAEAVKTLRSKAEESQNVQKQLDEDLDDLEKKTATIIRIEGLSVEEKEQTQQKLLIDISEAQKLKEKLSKLLATRNAEMMSMHQIHANVSERISKLQTRYKMSINQLLQKVSSEISAKTTTSSSKLVGSNFS